MIYDQPKIKAIWQWEEKLLTKHAPESELFASSGNTSFSEVNWLHVYASPTRKNTIVIQSLIMLKLNSLRFHHFFDDDAENHSVSEENRVQTWNNYQYHSGKPVVVVANENSVDLEKHRGIVGSRIDEKPLLLPIRSLKSTFPESISTTSPKSLSPSC